MYNPLGSEILQVIREYLMNIKLELERNGLIPTLDEAIKRIDIILSPFKTCVCRKCETPLLCKHLHIPGQPHQESLCANCAL